LRFSGVVIALFSSLTFCILTPWPARAQFDEPSEQLHITTNGAATWEKGGESVVALQGPVTIELDNATLTAREAVMWIGKAPGEGERQLARIALIGDAKVKQKDATRSGDELFVTTLVSGKIRFTAETRVEDDRSDTQLYENAEQMRKANAEADRAAAQPQPPPQLPAPQPDQPEPQPRVPAPPPPVAQPIQPGQEAQPPTPQPKATRTKNDRDKRNNVSNLNSRVELRDVQSIGRDPTTGPSTLAPGEPVNFRAGQMESLNTDDGTLAVALSDGVTIVQNTSKFLIEIQADQAVLFTNIKDVRKDVQTLAGTDAFKRSINAAYLEGDVRIVYTPVDQKEIGEQRLEAKRVYFEFASQRAILTEAVVHTIQPQVQMPVVMRAKVVRAAMAQGEFRAEDSKLSTSRFATPSYSINARKMYVRREATGDPRLGNRTTFDVKQPTFRFFDVPVFWLPGATGSMTDRGTVLRGIGFKNSTAYGTGVETEWGLFETLGMTRPKDLDATYELDYYSDRGPGGGLKFDYGGGVLSDALKEESNFEGKFEGWGIYDHGFDDFGRGRVGEYNFPTGNDDHPRGQVLYEHQHFFPDDWQFQFRAGYVSDATFLEQFFEREFDEDDPRDLMLNLKKQHDTEAFTLVVQEQPNDVVTTSDMLQEQFEVERLPELGYRRVGDSFWNDRLTFFSRNTVGGYRFNQTRATLAEQGFDAGVRSPGIPALGFTGVNEDYVVRVDFRQEIDMPLSAGQFKVVPYLQGRLTSYSDSPDGGTVNRLYGAVGARASTSFWKVYDHVESKLFDIHRVRHVIEPEVNVYAAGATYDRNDVFVYEQDVDAIHDVSAVQFALHQVWETKRGGPGRWRSVDFFTLNLEANLFSGEPDDDAIPPRGFRGLFFPSLPETSVPRDSFNADATWRLSDNTVVLADAQQNLNENRLATAGLGVMVRRDERVTYFVGTRYIDELSSNITTVALSYEISPKYTITASQSYDFGLSQNVSSSIGFLRQFDAFFIQVSISHDSTSDQSSFNFNLYPKGLGYGVNAEQLGTVFRNNQR
jgi:lipopolysaccharide assembly outer membrane protein LptD (OstA)